MNNHANHFAGVCFNHWEPPLVRQIGSYKLRQTLCCDNAVECKPFNKSTLSSAFAVGFEDMDLFDRISEASLSVGYLHCIGRFDHQIAEEVGVTTGVTIG
jgi:hypothetical protein